MLKRAVLLKASRLTTFKRCEVKSIETRPDWCPIRIDRHVAFWMSTDRENTHEASGKSSTDVLWQRN